MTRLLFYPRRDELVWLDIEGAFDVDAAALLNRLRRGRDRDLELARDPGIIFAWDDDPTSAARILMDKATEGHWDRLLGRLETDEYVTGWRCRGGLVSDQVLEFRGTHVLFGPPVATARADQPVYLLSDDATPPRLASLFDDSSFQDAAFGLLETLRAHRALDTGALDRGDLTSAALAALGANMLGSTLSPRSREVAALRDVVEDDEQPEPLRDLAVTLLEGALPPE
jgi:hypothetical protein